LPVPKARRIAIEKQIDLPAVHFSISASTHLKEWPLDHWIELAKILLRDRPEFHLLASSGPNAREADRLKKFSEAMNDPRLKIFVGLPLVDLAAMLKACALHLGADSGVLHLAAALDVPTLSFFREHPGSNEWLPRGAKHRSLTALCECETKRDWVCRQRPTAACLERISPASAALALREHLARISAEMA
jgi:ADP-heptose:LPS heptosyltransferase